MQIIPVIDLKEDLVVHAIQGHREQYCEIHSKIVSRGQPLEVVETFIRLFAPNFIYIADLNAITGLKPHSQIIRKLLELHPDVNFMLDMGLEFPNETFIEMQNCLPVVGTETNINCNELTDFRDKFPDLILSLDFNHGGLWGDKNILETPELWPEQIILMNLDSVGSDKGLHLSRLNEIKRHTSSRKLYYAGGIQNESDLETLSSHALDGVLLATALHNGAIPIESIRLLNSAEQL